MNLTTKTKWIGFVLLAIGLVACRKNNTTFIEDTYAKNLSIFSDKDYNIMSCYINNKSFRTRDRIISYGMYQPMVEREVALSVIHSSGTNYDTLSIRWQADPQQPAPQTLSLLFPTHKDSVIERLNALDAQRVAIDGQNAYFMIDENNSEKGSGYVYFHKAQLKYLDTLGWIGQLSGIFEATAPSFTVTKGRFDHSLNSDVVLLYH